MKNNSIRKYENKKILILGGSILQLNAIKIAKALGFIIGLIDYDLNAIGIEFVDEFFHVSTTNIKDVDEVFNSFRPDSVFTMATDMPMRVIGYLSDKYNLNYISYEDAMVATNKFLMIERFRENHLPHPNYFVVSDTDKDYSRIIKVMNISFPTIVKPVDSSGSRGVNCANSIEELSSCVEKSMAYSQEKKVIIEELLIGKEVSVEILVHNSIPFIVSITDKKTSGYPNFVEISHISPSRLIDIEKLEISSLAIEAVKAINIVNGAAHVEIMETKSGPYLIEVGARLGGDFITSHLVPYSTGYDIVKGAIDVSLNIKPEQLTNEQFYPTEISFFTPYVGKINYLPNLDFLINDNVLDVGYFKTIGDNISITPNSSNRLGYFIVKSDSYDKTNEISRKTMDKINKLFRNIGDTDEK